MPIIKNSIIINSTVENVFEISNDFKKWPDMMEEYVNIEILRREGFKIWFRLTHKSGSSWISFRVIDPDKKCIYAERHDPKHPFKYMHIIWTYEKINESSTKMTWTMSFELPDDMLFNENKWEKHLLEHTKTNQKRMKSYIEIP